MISLLGYRQKILFRQLILACFAIVLVYIDASAQTTPLTQYPCDYRNAANGGVCPTGCDYPIAVEKGCNCFDSNDNDGDGLRDAADPDCATFFGLEFVGLGSDCSITPPGASTPFDLVGPPAVSGQNTADTQSKVAAGDVDGNGIPDAVITSKWNSEVRVVATNTSTGLAQYGGDAFEPGDVIADFNLDGNTGFFASCDGKSVKNLLFEHEVLIADIDRDGDAEIFTVVSNRDGNPKSPPVSFYLLALRVTAYGPGGLQPLYPAVCLGKNRPGTFGIADMDGDGKAEIYLRDRIFAAETGKLLASPNSKLMTGTGTADWDVNVTSAPVAVDIKSAGSDNSVMELVCGAQIYKIPNLTNRNPASPGALTLWRDMNSITFDIDADGASDQYFVKLMNDPAEYGIDTHSSCSVADIDKDGFVDVVLTGALNSSTGRTAVYYWNVEDNTVTGMLTPTSVDLGIPGSQTPDFANYQNGWIWGAGRVNIGDANGDGILDLSFVSGNQLFCLSTNTGNNLLYSLWTTNAKSLPSSGGAISVGYRQINDTRSGVLTVTIYDFDNDGNPEMVYRDSEELAIIDGATGATKFWSQTCRSHTYTEGPIIADVNGDGNTDICVACNRSDNPAQFKISADIQQQALGEIRIFFSSGEWLPTRKVWNQPGYFVVNINDDLTLPFPQLDIATVFSNDPCANGLPGPQTPYNVFLNQVPFLSATGCPVFPAPDLTFIGQDPNDPTTDPSSPGYFPTVFVESPICGNLDIKVGYNVTNSGDLPINTTIPVSFYNGSPYDLANPGELLHSTTIPINNLSVGDTLSIGDLYDTNGNLLRSGDLPFIEFDGPGTTFPLFIVLYNDGSILPIDTLTASDTECDITNNFWEILVVPKPFTVNVDSIDNIKCIDSAPDNGQLITHIALGADTVIDLSPYAFQWYLADQTTPASTIGVSDTDYYMSDLPEGDYYVVITDTTKQCSSDPILGQVVRGNNLGVEIAVNVVSDQTSCFPPNGQLEAVITAGTNAGITWSWSDEFGQSLGVNGPILSGVPQGRYIVEALKNGCPAIAENVVQDFTNEPDVTGTVLANVVNCLNPNTGSITAEAFIAGVPQDSLDYTFDWYFYDTLTATTGSILPSSNGQPTKKGLAPGSYKVVVTETATGCTTGTSFDIVTITDSTVLPDIQMVELAPQTSCDATLPNGSIQADAVINGVVQDPATFTFEWFEGQNTVTPHLGGVSGTNGQVAINVKGGGQAYTIRITTENDCSVTMDTVIAEVINYPQVSLVTTPNSVCDQALGFTGSVTSTVSFDGNPVNAGDANYTFKWYDGPIEDPAEERAADLDKQAITQLDSGFYTLVVENTLLHCPSVATVEQVLSIKALPVITADADSSTNCLPLVSGNGGVQVTDVDGVGITTDYTFEWHRSIDLTGTLIASAAASPDTLQGSTGNFYTVLVRNQVTGCENTATVEVTSAPVLPIPTLTPTPNGICDETLTNPATSYNGAVASVITNQGANPIDDYEFNWTDEEDGSQALLASGAAGQNLTNVDSSYYTLVVTNTATGCVSNPVTAQVIADLALPIIDAEGIASTNCDPLLANGLAQVTDVDGAGTGTPYVFEWHFGADETGTLVGSAAVSPDTLQGATGRFYTVLVTNQSDGCQNTRTVEVPDASVLPLPVLTPSPNGICDETLTNPPVQYNGSVAAVISNQGAFSIDDYEFDWTDEETSTQVLLATGAAGQNLLNRDSSIFTLVATQLSTGCESNPVSAQVISNLTLPAIAADANASTNCDPVLANGGVQVTDVDAGGGIGTPYVFEWHFGTDLTGYLVSDAAASPDTLQGATGKFYTVLVTNQNDGCQNTETVEVPDARVLPLISLTPTPNSICDAALTNPPVDYNGNVGSAITNQGANLIDDYQFDWTDEEDGSQVLLAIGTAGQNINNLDSSYYTLVVTQLSTGCVSDPGTAQVTPDLSLPAITADAIAASNCIPSLANGTAQVTDVDGLGAGNPFIFEWHRGNTLAGELVANAAVSPDSLTGGAGSFYTVLVTNQEDGCQNSYTVEVPKLIILPSIVLGSTDNTICVGTPDGTASLTSVTYDGMTINSPDPFTGYSFLWSSGETTSTISNKAPAFYELVVTKDDVGCESNPVEIEVKETLVLPVILTTPTTQTSCDPLALNGAIDAAVNEGGTPTTAGYSFEWFTGTNVSNPLDPANVDPANEFMAIALPGNATYTVRVTNDATQCSNTKSQFVNEIISVPRVALTVNDIIDCSQPGSVEATIFADLDGDGSEEAVPLGDYGDYQFSWYRGTTTGDPQLVNTTGSLLEFLDDLTTPIPAGYYTAEVMNIVTTCASTDVTDLLASPGPLFDILVDINSPLPSSCADASGVITAYIDDGGTGTASGFTFEWYDGSITNDIQTPPASFYTDPPVMFQDPVKDVDANGLFGAPPYDTPGAIPGYQAPTSQFTGPTLYGIPSGTYTVVATRDADGCQEYLTTYLPYLEEPVIILAEIVPDECLGDVGEIGVDITVPAARVASDYKVWLIDGSNPALTPGADPNPFAGLVNPATATGNDFTGLASGVYTVVAQENFGFGCFSAPVQIEMREALPPLMEGITTAFNTFCDISVGDGTIEIDIESDPSDPFNPAYPPPPPPVVYNPNPQEYTIGVVRVSDNQDFSPGGDPYASGDNIIIPGLTNGDFDVTVTSNQGCSLTKRYTVPWVPTVAEIDGAVLKQDALFCDPALETNALAAVTQINKIGGGGGTEDFSDYEFAWYTDIDQLNNILTAQGDPTATKGGEELSNVNAPLPSQPVTVGSYWVVATKTLDGANNSGGIGCYTAPLKIDIADISVDPTFALTPLDNTACDAAYEGGIQVEVTNPGSVASATYTYNWDEATNPVDIETLAGADPAVGTLLNNGNGDGTDGDGDEPSGLQDGAYKIRVINDASGCFSNGSTTVLKNATPIIVATATAVDQEICDPEGSITVIDVTVGGAVDPNHNNFDFTWYQSDPNGTPIINEVNGEDFLDNVNFPTIGAGSYYVKAKRVSGLPLGSGCESAPLKKDIKDLSKDPIFTMTPVSNSACDINFEGSIAVLVTDPGSLPSLTYTYDWNEATNPLDIENLAGAPATGTINNDGDGDGADGDGDNPLNLQDGVYSLTVINDATGCSTTLQTTILKNTTPIIVASALPVDQFICNPDGSITVVDVTVGGVVDPDHNNFEFTWYDGDPNGTPIISLSNGEDVLDIGNYPTIGAGSYYVKARRSPGVPFGSGCESAPLKVDIKDLSENPLFTLTPFSNTACDADFEGSIQVTVTDPGSLPSTTYTYNWDEATNPIDIENLAGAPATGTINNDGDGDGADGDGDNPIDLQDGVYRITVINDATGCFSTGQTTITKTSTPIVITQAVPVDQVICNPDGSITVTEVMVGAVVDPTHTNFDFTWYQTNTTSTPIIDAVNGEDVLDIGNFPTIGAGSYFVKARRLSGLQPGSGCESAPFKVDIKDLSMDPIFTLTPVANTACDISYEGSIALVVTNPGSVASPTYTYNWDEATNPVDIENLAGAPATGTINNDGDGDGADGDGDNPLGLADGLYTVRVINDVTGCFSNGQTTILRNTTPIIVAAADKLDQLICNPDGSITVTEVTVGGTIDPNHNNFEFTWYLNDVNTVPLIDHVVAEDVLDIGNLPTIGAGEYFVKARVVSGVQPGSGCESAPLKRIIQDVHVNPIPSVQIFENSSCNLTFNGAIKITVTESQGPGVGQPYDYENFTDGVIAPVNYLTNNGNGLNDADNDSIPGLQEGTYTFLVRNQVTNCATPAQGIITYDPVASIPNIVNVDTNLPFDCFGNGGDATVTEIRIGSGPSILGSPALDPPNFEYDWYDNQADAFADPVVPGNMPIGTPTNTRFLTTLPYGTYFVKVRDLVTDCRSTPVEVPIDSTAITFPKIVIAQTRLQMSCDTLNTGSAQLVASISGDTNPDYRYQWFDTLDGTGNLLQDTDPTLVARDTLSDLKSGDFSVTAYSNVTGCASTQLFIVPDFDPSFLPRITLSGDPRTSCLFPNGSVVVKIEPFPNKNGQTYLPGVYSSYDFDFDIYDGDQQDELTNANPADDPTPLNMTFDPLPTTPPGSFRADSLDSFMQFTIRVVDNNTTCVVLDTITVKDDRRDPVPAVVIDNPLTNCDDRVNGQLSATADGGFTSDYDFYWWDSANPPPAGDTLSFINKLIGADQGDYTVKIVNKISGCEAEDGGTIIFDPKYPTPPSIDLIQPQTICWENFYPAEPLARPNGWLSANVEGQTVGYQFNWYVGQFDRDQIAAQPIDTTGVNYLHLTGQFGSDPGVYTVSAVDPVTGCYSVVSRVVPDERVLPQGFMETTPSRCDDVVSVGTGSALLNITNGVILRDVTWFDENGANVGAGIQVFNLFPGNYTANILTNEFCEGTVAGEIKTEIFAFNLVSVNGDTKNDDWQIDCISDYPTNNVKIFNRYGVKVYDADGYDNNSIVFRGIGENGLYTLGNVLPDGTYFFIIDKGDGSKPITGFLELVH